MPKNALFVKSLQYQTVLLLPQTVTTFNYYRKTAKVTKRTLCFASTVFLPLFFTSTLQFCLWRR